MILGNRGEISFVLCKISVQIFTTTVFFYCRGSNFLKQAKHLNFKSTKLKYWGV